MKCILITLILTSQIIYAQLADTSEYALDVREKIDQFENRLSHRVQIEDQGQTSMKLFERMDFYKTPGLSISIINNNKVEWSKSYGVKSKGSTEKINPETLFQVASISKPISALATLILVEKGSLSLDDPLNDYLKSWKVQDNEFTRNKEPCIRDLLSHSAGFTNGSVGDYLDTDSIPTLLEALNGTPPSEKPPVTIDFEPGTKWRYSGGGYSVLQQLLIDHNDMDFMSYINNALFRPLNMSHSFFQQPLSPSLSGYASKGHDEYGNIVNGGWTILPEMAAGGLWSTSLDLAKVIIEVNRSYLGSSNKIISKTMTREMLKKQKADYGLGFQIEGQDYNITYSHSGSNEGYRSFFVGYPERKQGVVILTNSNAGDALRWEIMRSLSTIYDLPNFQQIIRSTVSFDSSVLKKFEGIYEFEYSKSWVITISNHEDRLYAKLNEDPKFEIFPESENTFFSLGNTFFEFNSITDINYITLTLDGDAPYKWLKKNN